MSKNKKEDIELKDKTSEESSRESAPKTTRGTGKKLKYGSMSMAVVVVVIAIVVLLNLMCGLIVKRYPVKLDLTGDNRYELTDETVDVLKKLDKDVEITVTSPESMFESLEAKYPAVMAQYYGQYVEHPFTMIPQILEKYSVYAKSGKGSVNVKYVDINKDPDVIARFSKNYSGDITEQSMVFSCGDRVKVIPQRDIVGMIVPSRASTQGNIQMVFNGESTITSAIMSVADATPVRAAIVSSLNGNSVVNNNGASVAYSLEQLLDKNGYDCTEIDLGTDELADNYDLLVLCCPAYDFSEDIIAKMSDFLYNGGNYEKDMIYIPSLDVLNLPNISEFLADWKIQINEDYVKDDKNTVMISNQLYPTVNISDAESLGTVANDKLPIIAPFARTITVLSKNNEGVVKELIKSNDTSYTSSLADNTDSSERAEYTVVAKARKETASGIKVIGSDILVIGSPYMVDCSILDNTNAYNNAEVIRTAVNTMTGKENGAVIPEKSLQQNTISLKTTGARAIEFTVIIIIPALIALTGLVVLLRRKNR